MKTDDEIFEQVASEILKSNHKPMNTLRKIYLWLIVSSANPQRISLTIKSLGAFLVIFGVEQTDIDLLADSTIDFIMVVIQAISIGGIILGGARKIATTLYNYLER